MSTSLLWDTSRLRTCPTHDLVKGTDWYRISRLFGSNRISLFASKENRFDLTGAYLTDHIAGGLLETRLVFVDPKTGRYVAKTRAELEKRYLFRCKLKRNLRVANITAAIDLAIVTPLVTSSNVLDTSIANLATLYLTISQPFARDLRAALPDVDAFFWASRMGMGFNVFLLADPDDALEYGLPIMLMSDPGAQAIIDELNAGGTMPFA